MIWRWSIFPLWQDSKALRLPVAEALPPPDLKRR
jgi:hypothetical protein